MFLLFVTLLRLFCSCHVMSTAILELCSVWSVISTAVLELCLVRLP